MRPPSVGLITSTTRWLKYVEFTCVCVCVWMERKKKKKKRKKNGWFRGRENRNKKNEGREIWREKIKKLPGTEVKGGILERDLPKGIRFLGITGRNCFSAAQDNHGYASTFLMTIYLGEIKGS